MNYQKEVCLSRMKGKEIGFIKMIMQSLKEHIQQHLNVSLCVYTNEKKKKINQKHVQTA